MGYCLGQVLCAICFTQLLRYAQRRDLGVMEVSAVNYVVAAVMSIAVAWGTGVLADPAQQWQAAAMGVGVGAVYFVHMLVLLASYRIVGVGITVAMMSLGILMPVLVSWLVWNEPMPTQRWLAVGLFGPAVFLMRPTGHARKRLTLAAELILVGVFLGPGIAATMHKTVSTVWPGANRMLYQMCLFAAASILSVGYVRVHRLRYTAPSLGLGAAVGLCNAGSLLFIIAALTVLPATVTFPFTSSMTIVGSAIISRLLWRERFTARQTVGVVLAVAVVVLVNI